MCAVRIVVARSTGTHTLPTMEYASMAVTQLPPRTGQQYTIAFGDYTAVITQQGAGLRLSLIHI